MTYYKTCDQPGPHWHGTHTCRSLLALESADEEYVVPVAEGAIIEINDEAIERMARRFDCFFSTKYTDEDLREITVDLLRAAAGEKP